MRLMVASDIHFEVHADGGKAFVEAMDSKDVDVLVLAGDIGTLNTLRLPLQLMAAKFPKVFFVCGNHEYWGSSLQKTHSLLRTLKEELPNLIWAENDVVEIEGRRLLGTTLWFPETPLTIHQAHQWSDFKKIQGLHEWIYKANRTAQTFFRREMREGDVIVTHHLPSYECICPINAGAITNCFYANSLEDLIEQRKPAAWIHGHSHDTMRTQLYHTQIIRNPFGYVGYSLNPGYVDQLIVEI